MTTTTITTAAELVEWLADARAEYDNDAGDDYLAGQIAAAHTLGDILSGANDAHGWLPSWRWAEFDALMASYRTDAEPEPQRFPRVEDGCCCEWYSEDRGGGYHETMQEYDPACPVHSVHLYDPKAGEWVRRPDAQPTVAEVVERTRKADGLSPAIRDVAYERMTHTERGWTAEHDAEHGPWRLVHLAEARLEDSRFRRAGNADLRTEWVKAASLLVAAIELIDRQGADRGE